MKPLGFIYHEDYLKHDTGYGHPERFDRLVAIVSHLQKTGLWNKLVRYTPTAASLDWVSKVHPMEYIKWVDDQCAGGETLLDGGDTHVCKESLQVALLAAGAVLTGIDEVMKGNVDKVFCAVRPPGHHAETTTAMGFCLFNNVAIGARYAQEKYELGRVAVVDWDVHHGNGTQEIFYDDPSVLYISLHQYPLWPGTGAAKESGAGSGEGFTVNCPMKPGSGEKEYLEAFHQRILPALHKFQPQLLLVSAGFDAHKDDPLANINLTDESFAKMTTIVNEAAEKYCERKIVSVLEGGYNLGALARSLEAHLVELGKS